MWSRVRLIFAHETRGKLGVCQVTIARLVRPRRTRRLTKARTAMNNPKPSQPATTRRDIPSARRLRNRRPPIRAPRTDRAAFAARRLPMRRPRAKTNASPEANRARTIRLADARRIAHRRSVPVRGQPGRPALTSGHGRARTRYGRTLGLGLRSHRFARHKLAPPPPPERWEAQPPPRRLKRRAGLRS